jgi:hypothetical protein
MLLTRFTNFKIARYHYNWDVIQTKYRLSGQPFGQQGRDILSYHTGVALCF